MLSSRKAGQVFGVVDSETELECSQSKIDNLWNKGSNTENLFIYVLRLYIRHH